MKVLPIACAGAFVMGLAIGKPASTEVSMSVAPPISPQGPVSPRTSVPPQAQPARGPVNPTATAPPESPPDPVGAREGRSGDARPPSARPAVPQPPTPSPSAATPAEAPAQTARAQQPTAAPPPPSPPTRTRSRRSSRRNRYPGPIPRPEDWEPPEGPVRIALQAGHWRAHEAPAELGGLRDNGTRWRGMAEWEANLEVAERTADMLEDLGYEVDILPAVVPPGYRAHLFIAIHADGSNDPRATGYRVAAPSRDATGRAPRFARLLERSYGHATGIRRLDDTTRRMRNYYAFNFRRYEHALHPMTIAVIIETGFLTSARDRRVIVDAPERAARGIVEAVAAFEETPPPGRPERAPDGTP